MRRKFACIGIKLRERDLTVNAVAVFAAVCADCDHITLVQTDIRSVIIRCAAQIDTIAAVAIIAACAAGTALSGNGAGSAHDRIRDRVDAAAVLITIAALESRAAAARKGQIGIDLRVIIAADIQRRARGIRNGSIARQINRVVTDQFDIQRAV